MKTKKKGDENKMLSKKKKKYTAPKVEVCVIKLEEGIANGSRVSVGGSNGAAQPDIIEQPFEEINYDIEF